MDLWLGMGETMVLGTSTVISFPKKKKDGQDLGVWERIFFFVQVIGCIHGTIPRCANTVMQAFQIPES